MGKILKGVRVAVLAADGVEQVEVTVPVRTLRRAGADVRLISLRPGRVRSVNFLGRGRKLLVDDTIFDANPDDYGALLLPGGFVNPDLLRQSEHALDFVRAFEWAGKPIATLGHGPEVLISAGIVEGRKLASWPGIADDVRNAGGEWQDRELVHDGNWVSSRGPFDLPAFSRGMIELFAERSPHDLPELPRHAHWGTMLARIAAGAAALGATIYGVRRALIAARA
jgi:deglycase